MVIRDVQGLREALSHYLGGKTACYRCHRGKKEIPFYPAYPANLLAMNGFDTLILHPILHRRETILHRALADNSRECHLMSPEILQTHTVNKS